MDMTVYKNITRMKIVIYKSRKKATVITIAGLILGAIALVFFGYVDDDVFGWIFAIAAGLVLVLGIGNLMNREPQIILSETGISEQTVIHEEIEWDAIVSVDDFWFRGQDFIRLLLPRNYKPQLLRPSWFWRLDRIYAQEGVKAMYIRVSGLSVNSRQLAALIADMVKADPAQRADYLRKNPMSYK